MKSYNSNWTSGSGKSEAMKVLEDMGFLLC